MDRLLVMSRKNEKSQTFFQQAVGLHQAGQTAEALRAYDKAIALTPDIAALHEARGIALAQLERPEDGLKSLNRAVGLDRDNVGIYVNRGTVLNALDRPEAALADFDRAIALGGMLPAIFYGRGNALARLGRPGEAVGAYEAALALDPRLAVAQDGIGLALAQMGRFDEAIARYEAAIALDPGPAEFHFNRGKACAALRAYRPALESFRDAIARDENRLEFLLVAGPVFAEAGLYEGALALLDKALEIDPDSRDAHFGRGSVLQAMQRPEDALTSYNAVLPHDPDNGQLLMARDLCKLSANDWSDLATDRDDLAALVERSRTAPSPFSALALRDDPALHLATARRYMRDFPASLRPAARLAAGDDKVRIGYFSADFHNHATLHLMIEMLERHDRSRFEIFAYAIGNAVSDDWRERLIAAVDHWDDMSALDDGAAAARARADGLDIAVDLKGFTQHSRPGLFARRLAPMQLSWLGYPGTMGSSAFDYVLADEIVIPEAARGFYDEKVVYLPGCYQPNCAERAVSDRLATRGSVGLPEGATVYACFNQNYKIQRAQFDIWMRVLAAVPDSVLWLWVDNVRARENLIAEATAAGCDPARIVFADKVPVEEHLGRLGNADIFLDTLPYNAHTTASDALRMGVPVVTCMGKAFAGRVAASLLTAVGMEELIADTPEAYEALAIALGLDGEKRAALRDRLRAQVAGSALFDPERFARAIERAYDAVLERQRSGQPPEHIVL